MASGSPSPQKPACSICSRRKVKCDKGNPCSNCLKSQLQCTYEAPALHRRPRKRAADDELLNRLAAYEDLMRKHNVDFGPFSQTWIPSKLEARPPEDEAVKCVPLTPALTTPGSGNGALEETHLSMDSMERCLWSTISPELKHPPIYGLCHRDDPVLTPMPSLAQMFSGSLEIWKQHPEPRQIYRLWQIFVENVNPLLKLVHIPTLQQHFLDVSWDPSKAPKSLTAIMFAIYTLSVTSMSPEDCLATFNETRSILMGRYRTAAFQALVNADFLTTRDFEVVQALVLFLFTNPESELASTLTAAALKLCRNMGINNTRPDPSVSFFQREMRIRLWWQLYGLEARTRALTTPDARTPPSKTEFGDVRPPLNVNDADLHPDMTEAPAEHRGPTEMMCVLMKYEVFNWIRSSPAAAQVFEHIAQSRLRDRTAIEIESNAIKEIEAIYHTKYLQHMDKRIPLHAQAYSMANLVLTRMRFKVFHPRGRAPANGVDVTTSREEQEMVFELAMRWVELAEEGLRSGFSSHIFTHMTSKCHIDACIYVISELRRRCSGDRVGQAWKLIERFYNEYPELLEDGKNSFFQALGNLTLEAWEARRKALVVNVRGGFETPSFIHSLRERMRNEVEAGEQVSDLQNLDGFGIMEDGNLDWEYWNNFLS